MGDSFADIIEAEKMLLIEAEEKYGSHFQNSFGMVGLTQDFIVEVTPDAWIFSLFLSQIRKHIVLAFFSAVRRHHIQAMLNLRQVIEGVTNAAYAICNQDEKDFVVIKPDGTLDAPKDLAHKRYLWLEKNYPTSSAHLKGIKESINETTAHCNLIYGFKNFGFNKDKRNFQTPFFDIENEKHIKTDMWQAANIAMGFMDLFYEVNKTNPCIKFSTDFVTRLKELEKIHFEIKAEMIAAFSSSKT